MVHHAVEDGEPVARRGLRIGAVCPKLSEHACVVAAGDDLGFIGLSRGGIHVPTLAGVAPFVPVVKLVVVGVFQIEQRRIHIAHRRRTDVEHHAVTRVEVFRPAQHHAVAPGVRVLNAFGVVQVHHRWRALIAPHGVRPSVGREMHRTGAVWQSKRRHIPPFWAQKRRRLVFRHPALANEGAQVDALPAVGLHKRRVARHRFNEQIWIRRRVVLVGVVVGLVAAVTGPVSDDLLRDEVAQRRWTVLQVGALEAVDAAGFGERLVERHQRARSARRVQETVPEQAVRGVVHGRLLRLPTRDGIRNGFHVHVNQKRRGHTVVSGPSVVACDGPMVKVSRVHGGSGEVVSDGVEEGFVPNARSAGFSLGLDLQRSPRHAQHRQGQEAEPTGLVEANLSQVACHDVNRVARRTTQYTT